MQYSSRIQAPTPRTALSLKRGVVFALSLTLLTYSVGYVVTRSWDVPGLLVAVLAAGILATLCSTWPRWTALYVLLAVSTVYLALSLIDQMPSAWTQYREKFAAVRQWAWIPMMLPLIGGFLAILNQYHVKIIRNSIFLFFTVLIFTRALRILYPTDVIGNSPYSLYSINNDGALIIILFMISVFLTIKNIYLRLLYIILLLTISESAHLIILFIVFGLMVIIPRFTPIITYSFLLLLIVFSIMAPLFPKELARIDVNSGMRAIMWRDATVASYDTNFVGVGFGTEYIRNEFGEIRESDWYLTADKSYDRLYISNHSSLYDLLMRMGILGLTSYILLVSTMFSVAHHRLDKQNLLPFGCIATFLVTNTVNPGLSSINHLLGSCAIISFLIWSSRLPPGGLTRNPVAPVKPGG